MDKSTPSVQYTARNQMRHLNSHRSRARLIANSAQTRTHLQINQRGPILGYNFSIFCYSYVALFEGSYSDNNIKYYSNYKSGFSNVCHLYFEFV